MDIDARFVQDIEAGDRLNIIQFIAHLGLVDGCHYYIRTAATAEWDRMVPSVAHEAAHAHFDAIAHEFGLAVRDFLAQVYCRAFMQACAYLMSSTTDKTQFPKVAHEVIDTLVDTGKLELHFIGLESTSSSGVSVAQLYADTEEDTSHGF